MRHEFVDFIPEKLEGGVIYISLPYGTVAHKCACGCQNEVITPLSPTDWKLTYDGESISLHPSIGNWNFACKSHYWITNNEVKWSGQWTKKEIDAGKFKDRKNKAEYYTGKKAKRDKQPLIMADKAEDENTLVKSSFWSRLKKVFS